MNVGSVRRVGIDGLVWKTQAAHGTAHAPRLADLVCVLCERTVQRQVTLTRSPVWPRTFAIVLPVFLADSQTRLRGSEIKVVCHVLMYVRSTSVCGELVRGALLM